MARYDPDVTSPSNCLTQLVEIFGCCADRLDDELHALVSLECLSISPDEPERIFSSLYRSIVERKSKGKSVIAQSQVCSEQFGGCWGFNTQGMDIDLTMRTRRAN